MSATSADPSAWPSLPYAAWKDTLDTFHRWVQIVGKVRLARTPWLNHSWNATLYVTPRGLTTSPVPDGERSFQIDFDLRDHVLEVSTSDGGFRRLRLEPMSVAEFHAQLFHRLEEVGVELEIHGRPNELPDDTPFRDDREHASYDAPWVTRFWRVLLSTERVLQRWRCSFVGKSSPVHLFWGSLDLATTRFSGRRAPRHPGGIPHLPDRVTREAYSHEVSSAGFWAGSPMHPEAAYYAYAYPSPAGYADATVRPDGAAWDAALGEFLLPYEAVRTAPDPEVALRSFLESTWSAAADLGGWDREALERDPGPPTDDEPGVSAA